MLKIGVIYSLQLKNLNVIINLNDFVAAVLIALDLWDAETLSQKATATVKGTAKGNKQLRKRLTTATTLVMSLKGKKVI